MPWICFLKDVLFLQLILGFIIMFNVHGRIDVWMGLTFLVLYILYVAITVALAKPPTPATIEELEETEAHEKEGATNLLNDQDSEE